MTPDQTFTGANTDCGAFIAPTLEELNEIIRRFPKTRKPLRIFATPDACIALKHACLACAKDSPFPMVSMGNAFSGIPVETYSDKFQMILAALQSKARGERPIYFGPKEFLEK